MSIHSKFNCRLIDSFLLCFCLILSIIFNCFRVSRRCFIFFLWQVWTFECKKVGKMTSQWHFESDESIRKFHSKICIFQLPLEWDFCAHADAFMTWLLKILRTIPKIVNWANKPWIWEICASTVHQHFQSYIRYLKISAEKLYWKFENWHSKPFSCSRDCTRSQIKSISLHPEHLVDFFIVQKIFFLRWR